MSLPGAHELARQLVRFCLIEAFAGGAFLGLQAHDHLIDGLRPLRSKPPGLVRDSLFCPRLRRNATLRAQRFALVAKDGKVTHIAIEAPGAFEVSKAEAVLAAL